MCLTKVTKITNRKRKGWKVFYATGGRIWSLFFAGMSGFSAMPENVWIRDPHAGETITNLADSNYLTGFHVYLEKEGAERYANMYSDNREMRRIRFRKVVAQGMQKIGGKMSPTVVVEEMYVERRKEDAKIA